MKSTGSGGAQFELMLLRKECEDLRRQLDASGGSRALQRRFALNTYSGSPAIIKLDRL